MIIITTSYIYCSELYHKHLDKRERVWDKSVFKHSTELSISVLDTSNFIWNLSLTWIQVSVVGGLDLPGIETWLHYVTCLKCLVSKCLVNLM